MLLGGWGQTEQHPKGAAHHDHMGWKLLGKHLSQVEKDPPFTNPACKVEKRLDCGVKERGTLPILAPSQHGNPALSLSTSLAHAAVRMLNDHHNMNLWLGIQSLLEGGISNQFIDFPHTSKMTVSSPKPHLMTVTYALGAPCKKETWIAW